MLFRPGAGFGDAGHGGILTTKHPNFLSRMNTDKPNAVGAATTVFGLRREAKRHAAFGSNRQHGKRCRRCALPPQSKSLSSVREVAGLYYGFIHCKWEKKECLIYVNL
jgi:hypothetical protein